MGFICSILRSYVLSIEINDVRHRELAIFINRTWSVHVFAITVSVWLLCVFSVNSIQAAHPITAKEHQLRAAVILGIIRFTSWPVSDNKQLVVCTVGQPISESVLLPLSGNSEITGRELIVRKLDNNKVKVETCHVTIYGKGVTTEQYSNRFHTTVTLPVLTICDDCDYSNSGIVVKLLAHKNRIGFKIDLREIKTKGLLFSSSLLELALEVKR